MAKVKKKKPTNKKIVQEISYLGQRLMMTERVLNQYIKLFDLYLNFKKDSDKFKKFVEDLAKKDTKVKEKNKDGK